MVVGVGGFNLAATRIGPEGGEEHGGHVNEWATKVVFGDGSPRPHRFPPLDKGRWPANVVLDEAAGAMLDAQSGQTQSPDYVSSGVSGVYETYGRRDGLPRRPNYGDMGGASRFFYCPKASTSEREYGLNGETGTITNHLDGVGGTTGGASRQNLHPTVKPVELMRWLVRLVTPPGGLVLDPFTGSGSTGVACKAEGFRFLGVEQDEAFVVLARERIETWVEG